MIPLWAVKLLNFVHGRQTVEGCICIAFLGHKYLVDDGYPRFSSLACINKSGLVGVLFWDRHGKYHGQLPLGKLAPHLDTVDKLRDQFRKLADKLAFDDDERQQMFDLLKAWLAVDERADSNMPAIE